MISLEEALALVQAHALPPTKETIAAGDALQRVLAEIVSADRDMPPFDKSAMDGFACRQEDLSLILEVIEDIPAGRVPGKEIGPGQCARIMTGSMLPPGADCVIKVEDTSEISPSSIRFTAGKTQANICYQGEDCRAGAPVLLPGTLLQAQHLAVLASVGKTRLQVFRSLPVAILSTGDELVEPGSIPGTGLIRNSNASQLLAQLEKLRLRGDYRGIAPDEETQLLQQILSALQDNDLLLISGGISMGDYDLVPDMLRKAGFTLLFQKIAVQPGSPTLLAAKDNKRVFGLPGNPVSSFVQFEWLVKPLIYKSMGHAFNPMNFPLPLGQALRRKKAERVALLPVSIREGKVYPLDYHGSAHIHAYLDADAIGYIPIGIHTLEEGDPIHVRLL